MNTNMYDIALYGVLVYDGYQYLTIDTRTKVRDHSIQAFKGIVKAFEASDSSTIIGIDEWFIDVKAVRDKYKGLYIIVPDTLIDCTDRVKALINTRQ